VRLVDSQGRLFGRLNVIDAFVLAFVLLLVPVGYAAYAVFRLPAPSIESVTPTEFVESPRPRVRITGRNLMPYLSAYISPAGQPLPRYLDNRAQTEATFLIESPLSAVLDLPPLTPGVYDLYLFNQANQLVKVANAFTVESSAARKAQAEALRDKTVAELRVRVLVEPELAVRPKAGDVDTHGSPTNTGEPDATLLGVDRGRLRSAADGSEKVPLVLHLRVPVSRGADGLWSYKGHRARVGETMAFGTRDYYALGMIIDATIPEGVRWDEPR
jgi:hypothetical protein